MRKSEKKREKYEKQYQESGVRYKELKSELSKAIYEELKPIQKKRKELEARPEYIDDVVKEGAEKARKVAGKTLQEVKEKMGLN